ncbi:hypothetical protein PG2000B_1129 [Bifidobacterium pseudolongum subsp. globosum]|uniref:hypothetical protein n=1 Tax=Bifidobacterium pseudolongum TaxID=1694 RepID=UPI00101F27C9|nr:hypothetical protein [Bifidobacterium pseudolongum]RYQ42436.1 hypothetical protein PG2000B_1129 [Bifidobacterium pseudolongum subsp. globosum]
MTKDPEAIPDDAQNDIPPDDLVCASAQSDSAAVTTEPFGKQPDEDMSRRDGPHASSNTDPSLGSVTGWHPFLRFIYRVADMVYAFIPDRRKRVHAFVEEHPKSFWAAFICDYIIVAIGSGGVICAGIFAILRTFGLIE